MKKERKDREKSEKDYNKNGGDASESDEEDYKKDKEYSYRRQKKSADDSARAEDKLKVWMPKFGGLLYHINKKISYFTLKL